MPVYSYECPHCGPFSDLRPAEDSSLAQPCPHCGTPSDRVLVMPRLTRLSAQVRDAHAVNERAAHAPLSVEAYQDAQQRKAHAHGHHAHGHHVHGPGCGCGSTSATTGKTKTLVRPDGAKSFPADRPWMISH